MSGGLVSSSSKTTRPVEQGAFSDRYGSRHGRALSLLLGRHNGGLQGQVTPCRSRRHKGGPKAVGVHAFEAREGALKLCWRRLLLCSCYYC